MMKKISFILYLFLLVFAPLAFGSSELWAKLVMSLLISLSAIVLAAYVLFQRKHLCSVPGLLPLLLLLGWMTLQIIPLPVEVVRLISHNSFEVYKPILEVSGTGDWIPLTVNLKNSLLELIRVSGYMVFYVLTIQFLKNNRSLEKTVWVTIYTVSGIVFFAILQNFLFPDAILGFRKAPVDSLPFGPWVNRNQFAGYVGMILPLVIGLFIFYQPILEKTDSFRVKLVTFLSMMSSNRQAFLALTIVVLTFSVFISLSRGGIVSITFSLIVFFSLLFLKKTKGVRWSAIVIISCLIFGGLWAGIDQILVRFDNLVYEFSGDGGVRIGRIPVWQDSIEIIGDFLITGTGFGTFVDIYPSYRTVLGTAIYEHAHNDYLELLTDGGLIGGLLVSWFVCSVIIQGWKKIRRRRDNYSILIGIGALSGMMSMLCFSVTDFNMKNGADGVIFFFLCGLLISAGNTRFQFRSQKTLLPKVSHNWKIVLLLGGVMLLCSSLFFQTRMLLAKSAYNSVVDVYLSRQLAKKHLYRVAEKYDLAASYDPFEGLYFYLLGNIDEYLSLPDQVIDNYTLAAYKKPLQGVFLQRLALRLPENQRENATVLMREGYTRGLYKDELLLSYVEWLLLLKKRQQAIFLLKEGVKRNKDIVTQAAPLLQSHSFTRKEVTDMLGSSVDTWVGYGSFLEKMGEVDEADFYLGKALDYLDYEQKYFPHWFVLVYNMYLRRHMRLEAFQVLRQAVEKVPDYYLFRVWLGDYFLSEGILYRAEEEYKQALFLNPGNESVREKLNKLQGNTT